MRLIDADALIDFIDCGHLRNPLESCFSERDVVDMLESRTTIAAAPVVRGEWRWHEEWKESTSDGPAECQSAGYKCSVCGIDLSEYLSESLGETIYADNSEEAPKIDFCPNCGAKMEV